MISANTAGQAKHPHSRGRNGCIDRHIKSVRGRRLPFKFGIGFMFLMLIAGVAAGLLAKQASDVRNQLLQSVELVQQLRSEVEHGDHVSAQQTLTRLEEQTSDARSTVAGPLWEFSSFVPLAGPNISAVREVAVSADDIVSLALAPLLEKYDSLDWRELSPTEGRINVTELQKAAPTLSAAADSVEFSYSRMTSIDLTHVIPEIAEPIRSATEQLHSFAETLGTTSAASRLLPALLGADQPQKFLVLVQNSAESRATGGIAGAFAILDTDKGQISLGEQGSASDVGSFLPSLVVDEEQEALYTARLGTHMQNVNLTPDFPTAAQTAKQMWESRNPGQIIDGVIALDPVVLSHLLAATGPVNLDDLGALNAIRETSLPSSLTADNVVPTLLSDVYREIEDPRAQDLYFAAVAAQVFHAFMTSHVDTGKLMDSFGASTEENRLYLWSSHTTEQEIIASTPLHGSVAGPDAGGTAFGVYFNDGTGAKMDFYANRSVQLIQSCPIDGYRQYTVRVTASNNAPADAASSLPEYVTGGGVFGVEPGRIRTNYVFYGPPQAFVETAIVDGQSVPVSSGKHRQRPVGTVAIELGPGETSTIEVVFSRVVQDSAPQLRVTPTIQSPADVIQPLERETCG